MQDMIPNSQPYVAVFEDRVPGVTEYYPVIGWLLNKAMVVDPSTFEVTFAYMVPGFVSVIPYVLTNDTVTAITG